MRLFLSKYILKCQSWNRSVTLRYLNARAEQRGRLPRLRALHVDVRTLFGRVSVLNENADNGTREGPALHKSLGWVELPFNSHNDKRQPCSNNGRFYADCSKYVFFVSALNIIWCLKLCKTICKTYFARNWLPLFTWGFHFRALWTPSENSNNILLFSHGFSYEINKGVFLLMCRSLCTGFVQGAEAIPVIVGVPMTGYINQQAPRAGFYFSTASTLAAALLLFFVGFSKREPDPPPPAPAITISETCRCITPPPRFEPTWCACSAGGATAYCAWPGPSCGTRLPKSYSYAAPLNRTCCSAAHYPDCCRRPIPLRPSRSVPEGLANRGSTWNRAGSCRSACKRREHHLIEQITTSVWHLLGAFWKHETL